MRYSAERGNNLGFAAVLLLLIVPIVLLISCGGSGAGAVLQPPPNLVFVPASAPASGAVTLASGGGSTGDLAVIDIEVTDVMDVHTASFTLTYDSGVVGFIDFDTAGSHLGSDGTQLQAIVQENSPGTLTVGLTRLGATGIEFNGTEPLISIHFSRVAATGTSSLDFVNSDLLDATAPPQPIPGIQWFGGSFQVN